MPPAKKSKQAATKPPQQQTSLLRRTLSDLHGLNIGLWEWDNVSNELRWSQRFMDIVGLTHATFRPHVNEFSERLHPEDQDRVMKALYDHININTHYDVEYRLRRADGTYIWLHAIGQAERDDKGNPSRMAGFVYDISERKKIEAALRVSEERYNLAVRGMSAGLKEWNPITGEAWWSPKFDEIIGNTDPHMDRSFKAFTERIHPDDLDRVIFAQQRHLAGAAPYDIEYRIRHNNGDYIWVHATGQAVWNDQGKATRMVGSIFDIMPRKKVEQERDQLIDKLSQSNKELERFAYIASHDMIEPLRAVRNLGDVLLDDFSEKIGKDGTQYIDQIVQSSSRMQTIIDDLLEYALLNQTAATPPESFNASQELTHALENLSSVILENKARITRADLPAISGSASQFMRLMQNLISNSLRYRHPKRQPEVQIGVEDHPSHWHFFVKDNGLGIDAEHCDQIFEPFTRFHPTSQSRGTGLGLSICKKIVEHHGGQIAVTSTVGKGSLFSFTWPKAMQAYQ